MADSSAPEKLDVGTTVKVKEGADYTRPNGQSGTVTGGLYVLDVPGTHLVAGSEYLVK